MIKIDRRADLFAGDILTQFSKAVSDAIRIAILDHENGKRRRSGNELANAITSSARTRHQRLLSGVYNQVRDECESRDAGK